MFRGEVQSCIPFLQQAGLAYVKTVLQAFLESARCELRLMLEKLKFSEDLVGAEFLKVALDIARCTTLCFPFKHPPYA